MLAPPVAATAPALAPFEPDAAPTGDPAAGADEFAYSYDWTKPLRGSFSVWWVVPRVSAASFLA